MILGFSIALGINSLPGSSGERRIFVSLLPMIITPLIGALIVYWMINSNGVIGANLQALFHDPNLYLKASPVLTWVILILYGIWTNAPFSFVIFYAGLQMVPQDTLESAMVDGASRWDRVRFVVMPSLTPLATFVALVQLMDNFRVFEPIVGFNAQANASSLSSSIFDDLHRTSLAAVRLGGGHLDADHCRRDRPACAGARAHLARILEKGGVR